jgi:FKBP-type peptidyl-prolyl cis-trans isomerase SlyD
MIQVGQNKVVSVFYTLTNDAGEVLESREERGPLLYLHGSHTILPGLEEALEGKAPGDRVQVHIPAEDGYGGRDERMVTNVPRGLFGEEPVRVGGRYEAVGPGGETFDVTVTAEQGDQVVVDANHPLAGVGLNFDATVVDVRDATLREIEEGSVLEPPAEMH